METASKSVADRMWACRLLEAIILNAEIDAQRVASFLKLRGLKPSKPRARTTLLSSTPTGPVADMLLNLAAALRLRSWERAGLAARFGAELPSSIDALAAAADCAMETPPATEVRARIPRTVFRILLQHFALSGQADLGTDIVVQSQPSNDLLDQVAALLWAGVNS